VLPCNWGTQYKGAKQIELPLNPNLISVLPFSLSTPHWSSSSRAWRPEEEGPAPPWYPSPACAFPVRESAPPSSGFATVPFAPSPFNDRSSGSPSRAPVMRLRGHLPARRWWWQREGDPSRSPSYPSSSLGLGLGFRDLFWIEINFLFSNFFFFSTPDSRSTHRLRLRYHCCLLGIISRRSSRVQLIIVTS
jgi:hypothetical protein